MTDQAALEPVAALLGRVLPLLRQQAAAADDKGFFPAVSMQSLRDEGLLGLTVPARFGGGGASLRTFVAVAQELAGACLSTAHLWAMHCFQVDAIARHGSVALRDTLLPKIAAGDVYIASVTSERGRSADLFTAGAALRTEGDDLLVERSAPVVSGGAHADGFLLTMRASEDASEHEVSLVYADRRDLRVDECGDWDTLGMRGTASGGLELSGKVPASNLVGGRGGFAEIARTSMIPLSHLGWSACWLGAARGALVDLVAWFRGNPPPPGELFYERLAHVRVELELVSAYLHRVLEQVELARAEGRSLAEPRTQLQLNALKVVASEHTFHAVDRMVELGGLRLGYGRRSPVPLERHFRDLRSASLNHANDRLWTGIGALTLLDRSVSLI
ncbi:acyl-CoA dehydrogenase [Amycolatopsis balhimycina DSM 5908]|uniref:Acyl-CoA dehydrogenase n=1 Tax=Amycolatopsis balhimycina DSM 5908 TaxID=1081091 RepID=A0A428X6D6_AMYBA|nr:acyl-CoA dehydrogenase family protein [Amycolatopsis balhimycina]RSM50880.1 acyl-CoA dehydrogenase [Amycolatopsis balhimycina DSM 5908]